MSDKNNSDSTVYRWLAQAALSGLPEIEVAARAMMDYYEGAESPTAATASHDTPELRRLVNAYRDACAVQGHAIAQWRALVAHLDGAPARPMLGVDQVRDLLRGYIEHCHGSQTAAARVWGVTPGYVSAVLKGHTPPNDAMLADLGLERVVVYRRKETPP